MSCDSSSGVSSFNGRRGAVSLLLQDVINVLGGTPLRAPVANASLAEMATMTVKANLTAGSAVPQDVTLAALAAALGASLNIVVTTLTSTAVDIKIAGLIVKIGISGAVTGGVDKVITFPVAFPTACTGIFTQVINSTDDLNVDIEAVQLKSKNAAAATFFPQDSSGNIPDGFLWLAFGL
jgi:hypothetical protein